MITRRFLAFAIDYIIIVLYALTLFGICFVLSESYGLEFTLDPIKGQIIGFLSLTLPVFLYFVLLENSAKKGTFGKQLVGIKVVFSSSNGSILRRNILKFLPWEIAHTGVHWMYYYNIKHLGFLEGGSEPWGIWLLLLIPQVIVLVYAYSIFKTKGSLSLYDSWAGTKIEIK